MSAPPGRLVYTAEPPVEHISGDRVTDLSTKSGQERYLVSELGVTHCQAKALLRAYALDQRDARRRDGADAAHEEFSAWFTRRGDLLTVRSKMHVPWRVHS